MIINIAVVSYTAAALAFTLVTLLLLTSWRGRSQGALLTLACATSALWAAVIAYSGVAHLQSGIAADVLEILRSAAWFLLLVKLLEALKLEQAATGRMLQAAKFGLLGYCLLLIGLALSGLRAGPNFSTIVFLELVGRVILAILGMALVEQLFRNTPSQQRWGMKFFCLGVGGMFAYDFFFYSDAMLFKHVDTELATARGIINVLVVPLITISAARNPQWALNVSVSRRIVFHSAALLGAGIYLLVMAAAGYYIRVFGGNWGAVLQTAFLFGAGLVLATILFSGTLRARLRVFLSKHFFSYKYDYREEWLRFTRTLSHGEPGERLRERAIQAIAELVESQSGALWLARDSRLFTRAAHWNMPMAEGAEAVDSSFSAYLRERQWVINLEEYDTQPELYTGLTLPPWLVAIPHAWLVVPMVLHDQLLGFMVLARSLGRVHFNWEVSDLLKTAARQATTNLAQMDAAEALIVARQFESFNRASAFVVHDLKNLVAQLSLMLANAKKHQHEPEFQEDMISTVENSVEKMNRLLIQLRSGSNNLDDNNGEIDLAALLQEVVAAQSRYKLKPSLILKQTDLRIAAHPERLLRVLGHIVQNAIEATPYTGKVEVRLVYTNSDAVIEIEDSGCGMDGQFIRERLFRPFDSTKGSGMGIGAYECREYIRELGGQVEVTSAVSRGSTFYIRLPLRAAATKAANLSVQGAQG